MKTHELKCWPEYFKPMMRGEKRFEIRQNDRDFRVGDMLRLREFDPTQGLYTGLEMRQRVTYLTDFAQQPGYVVLSVLRDAIQATYDEFCAKFPSKSVMRRQAAMRDPEAALAPLRAGQPRYTESA